MHYIIVHVLCFESTLNVCQVSKNWVFEVYQSECSFSRVESFYKRIWLDAYGIAGGRLSTFLFALLFSLSVG